MEKKGDLLNQLAIISDLIENVNLTTKTQTIMFDLDETTFKDTFEYIEKKYGKRSILPKSNFEIYIGNVKILFNKNSV